MKNTVCHNNFILKDIDECLDESSACNQLCNNTIGGYNCSCETGYQLDTDEVTCIDIDECIWSNGGCEGTCNNTEGSYICLCPSGYYLLDKTCIGWLFISD